MLGRITVGEHEDAKLDKDSHAVPLGEFGGAKVARADKSPEIAS